MRVPFAVDESGQLCSPIIAIKGQRYFCPTCGEPIIFKQGKQQTPYFFHKSVSACRPQTIIHTVAKMLLQKTVLDWKNNKSSQPILRRACQICDKSINQPLPEKVEYVTLDYQLTHRLVVDVALIVGEVAKAAVLINVGQSINCMKFRHFSIPVIALDGYAVTENPLIWKPIVDQFKPLVCDGCKLIYEKFQLKIEQIAKLNNMVLPTAYYRYGFCQCWKCQREIIVFAWPTFGMYSKSNPKFNPIPKTIQYRFSKTVEHSYWLNTCPYCDSIQGDFFLHAEPDGPFFGVDIRKNTATAFRKDLMKIAQYAAYLNWL